MVTSGAKETSGADDTARSGAIAPGRTTRAWVIENPMAGQGDWTEQVDAAVETFRAAGWDTTLRETAGPGEAAEIARAAVAEGIDVVVVAGGDGTVNEALQGLAGQRGTALAVLPGGTVNVWATELGVDKDEADLAQRIVAGRRHTIDLGRVNDRYFLMMASAGVDAEASALVVSFAPLKRLKRVAGPVAYALSAGVTLLRFRGHRVRLTIDGQIVRRRLLMMVVGNTRLYGGISEITYRARADDGLLDLCVLTGRNPIDLLRRAWSVFRRRQDADPAIDYRRVREIILDADHPLSIQADGEDVGSTPATFQVHPEALEVIILSDTPPGFLGEPEGEEA